ncbi:MAG: RNA polymerase sigma factor [Butyrivibrio sp.]|nr:RNA polymerase sigma factor [Butyrivibrio sp.]
MNDNEIIDLFFKRSEKAITHLSDKYGYVLMKVSMNLVNNYSDAEECLNDAYLNVWNAIPPQTPKYLLAFVCRIVRNISIDRYRRDNAQKRNGNYDLCIEELEECIASKKSIDEEITESELAACINEFLGTLGELEQMIFVRRFWYFDTYEDIASKANIRANTIRVRIFRTKAKMKAFLEERGILI